MISLAEIYAPESTRYYRPKELSVAVDDAIEIYIEDGKPLPQTQSVVLKAA